MLVVMHSHATTDQIDHVLQAIRQMTLTPHALPGATRPAIGCCRPRALRHDDHAGREPGELRQHAPLAGGRFAEDGVQRRDDRHPQVAEQGEDVVAGGAAEDAPKLLYAWSMVFVGCREDGHDRAGVN